MTDQKPARGCDEPGCDRPRFAQELCSLHYNRRRRAGTITPVRSGPKPRPKLDLDGYRRIAEHFPDAAPLTAEDIKTLADRVRTELGLRCDIKDLLAMAPSSDPFYIGADDRRARYAQWFVDVAWPLVPDSERGGDVLHLRRIHYRLGSVQAPGPNGDTYKLSDSDTLQSACSAARALRLIPDLRLVDRRNSDALDQLYEMAEPDDPTITAGGFDRQPSTMSPVAVHVAPWIPAPAQVTPPTLDIESHGLDFEPDALYVMVEKSTVSDIVGPLCKENGVTFVALSGISSITVVQTLVDKIEREAKPAHIAYLSDFDQAGALMPRQVARWMERAVAFGELTVPTTLHPLALTEQQVREHRLPLADLDLNDNRHWHLDGRVELDALVALAPGVLEQLIRDWVEPFRGDAYHDRARLSQVAIRDAETQVAQAWEQHVAPLHRRQHALERLERYLLRRHDEQLRQARDAAKRVAAILQPFNDATATLQRHAVDLAARMQTLTDTFDPDLPDRPDFDPTDPDTSTLLYFSERSYLEQLVAYREHDPTRRDDPRFF